MTTQPTPTPAAVRAAEALFGKGDPDIAKIAAIIHRETGAEVAELHHDINALKATVENANSALGFHPDSATDIAVEIARIRDECRANFHENTKLREQVTELVAALRKLRDTVPTAHCEDFYHAKKDRHELGQDCPLLKRHAARLQHIDALLARYPQQQKE